MYKIHDSNEIAFWKHKQRAHKLKFIPTCALCKKYQTKIEKDKKDLV